MTATLDWLFARGHAADLVLAFMVIEFIWLVRATGAIGVRAARASTDLGLTAEAKRPRGSRAIDAAFALLPGAAMIVAVRAALTGQAWWWVALPLALSLPLHLADLRRREWWH